MKFLRLLLTFLSFLFVAMHAGASPASPQNGVDFITTDHPRPARPGQKIEVIEFFGYFCSHCSAFDPLLQDWIKKQGNRIEFKRLHTAFGGKTIAQQRMYLALEALGKAEELHAKIFQAIHVERKPLMKEDAIIEFVVNQGIDKQKFLDAYNSFGVQTKAARIAQLEAGYKITGVPNLVIDAHFITSPSIAARGLPPNRPEPEQQAAALKIMDTLVDQAMKAHAGGTTEK